ncbi:hypothetical protein PAHAL_8G199400 [Panicum hallii]|uniref:Uncharacterized protein n=1 Tax=Panicum hallii TaxID=206008 RepID=A0A2T8I9J9_9POAL|nr:hypothetical protein PAHAL_8G199400 [Panicum hallii]
MIDCSCNLNTRDMMLCCGSGAPPIIPGLLLSSETKFTEGGYGMVYKLQRPADFVISRKPNLLITLCSGVLLPLQIWCIYWQENEETLIL